MSSNDIIKEFMLDFPVRFSKFEQTALEAGLDIPISISEIHIINKIGPEGAQKMNAIAKKLGVTQATLTVACDKLEAKDLIVRRRDPDDKRAVIINLTSLGLVAYSFHQALMDNITESFISAFTPAEADKISRHLMALYEELEG